MNPSSESNPLVLDYLKEYTIYKQVLFWKPLYKYVNRVDLMMRIEDELMRNADNLGIIGLSYCPPRFDMSSIAEVFKNREPAQMYHSDKHKSF